MSLQNCRRGSKQGIAVNNQMSGGTQTPQVNPLDLVRRKQGIADNELE